MNLGTGTIWSLACALAGVALGRWFSKRRSPYWLLGYFLPLTLIFIYGVAIHIPALAFTPPISWMMMGQRKFAIFGFIASMVLTTPLSRLPLKRNRVVISILTATIVLFMSVWPFLAPLFNRTQLALLKTRVDGDGVCLQNTGYTCGPASAVTALRKLGLPAEEGQIAILSGTSSTTGTPPDILAEVLLKQYGQVGLVVKYQPFKTIAELKSAGLTLAVVKFGFMVDHYVTVLEVTDSQVIVGDPLNGLEKLSYAEFADKWRFSGIVLKRKI